MSPLTRRDVTTTTRAFGLGPAGRAALVLGGIACISLGAYAAGAEARRGVVAPGMDADLVVLRGDFFEMELRELLSTRVELTVFAGRVVYSAP